MKKQKISENADSKKSPKKDLKEPEESVDEQIFKLVSTIVQWYLVLEEVSGKKMMIFPFRFSRFRFELTKWHRMAKDNVL